MPKCGDTYCKDGAIYERCGQCITQEGVTEDFHPVRTLPEEVTWDCPGPCVPQRWSLYYCTTVLLEKSLQLYRFLTETIYGDSYNWSLVKSIGLFAFGIRMILNISKSIQEECDKKKKCQEMKKRFPKHMK
ncbi:uncharacterized protein LOC126374845 [Pectinophora gossypiella]|uniref:uncharacterized protein LOC126374845 n=1 Tax=Pectinophora gossypiella TaxID=13191 RepID=UPI00214E4C23|nr:uncharacterized protein LOC126374845 [Pectinophora gossypiella]